jgi:hypothetical protein
MNIFCTFFDIEQQSFFDERQVKYYFMSSEFCSGVLVFISRNLNFNIPVVGYIYAFWPSKSMLKKLSSDHFSFLIKSKDEENDDDILSAMSGQEV